MKEKKEESLGGLLLQCTFWLLIVPALVCVMVWVAFFGGIALLVSSAIDMSSGMLTKLALLGLILYGVIKLGQTFAGALKPGK